MGTQLAMAGTDWLSDTDRKRQQRAEAARKKAAIKCAKALQTAADALGEFGMACLDCNDASRVRGDDDGRLILAKNCREYAGWLDSVYSKE